MQQTLLTSNASLDMTVSRTQAQQGREKRRSWNIGHNRSGLAPGLACLVHYATRPVPKHPRCTVWQPANFQINGQVSVEACVEVHVQQAGIFAGHVVQKSPLPCTQGQLQHIPT